MTDGGRKLRAPKQQGGLFEYDLSYYDYDAPLILVGSAAPRASSPKRRSHNGRTDKPPGTKKIPCLPVRRSPTVEPLPASDAKDPLPMQDFLGHHRRMERNEKRMQHLDLQQLLVDAEKVTAQREALLAPDWRRNVQRIIKIDSPDDSYEVETKRKLALAEMGLFLERFDRFKRRERDREKDRERERSKEKDTPTPKRAAKPKAKKLQPARSSSDSVSSSSASPEPLDGLVLHIPHKAFGAPLPPRRWRPCEFDIPRSWKKERK